MKILLLSVGDNGGGTYFISDAINKYTEHEARGVRCMQSWINYPYDIAEPTQEEINDMIAWADIVHVRDNAAKTWNLDGKKVVVTFTGVSYRNRAAKKLAYCRSLGWFVTVSTPDLLAYTPDNPPLWTPNPREKMMRTEVNGQFTACHAPTFRERKGTQGVIEACSKAGVKLELIENKQYIDCLKRKSQCDLVVDQFTYGYGNNAIEAWSMGMPAIGDVEDKRYAKVVTGLNGGGLPYVQCSQADLAGKLLELRDNPMDYARAVEVGQEYFYRYHHAPVVAKRLVEIYEGLL